MSTVLVTGANRGIGLGLVRQLLAQPEPPILLLATSRNPAQSTELQAIAAKNATLKILKLDVNDTESFAVFAEEVAKEVGDNGLNVLINNAGVISRKGSKIEDLEVKDYLNVLTTNVVGTVFLTKALLPSIRLAAKKNEDKPKGFKRAVIANISSLVGSLADNRSGGLYAYRESKSALNMFSTNLKLELEGAGILVVPIHPGWVQTDMGGSNAPVQVDQSASGIVNVIYKLDDTKNGHFLNFDGSLLPW